MTMYIFLVILFILALIDFFYFKIPNVIVLPAIILGISLTGNWLAALMMFFLTAFIYKINWWRGGDVKLMTMIGAFLGMEALFILILTLITIFLFRITTKYRKALAVTPFSLAVTLPFIIYSLQQ